MTGTLPGPLLSVPPTLEFTSPSPLSVLASSLASSPALPPVASSSVSPSSSPLLFSSLASVSPSPSSEEPPEDSSVSPASPALSSPSSLTDFSSSSSTAFSSIHLYISSARARTSSVVSSSLVFFTKTFSSSENVTPFCFLKNRLMRSIRVSLEMSSPSTSKKFFSPSSAYPRLKIPTEPGYFFWTIFSIRASSRMLTTPLLSLREITSSIISRGVQSA